MTKSFITVLANDEYLKGALVLNESIKRTNSKYKLVILVGDKLSKKAIDTIKKANIEIIKPTKNIELPEKLIKKNHEDDFDYWSNTFLKLLIFDLVQFEKLVFIDCDVIVLENIDDLFEKPHMSAIPFNKYLLNDMNFSSGLFVVEPKENFSNNFLSIIENFSNPSSHIGDWDILNSYYPDWTTQEHLHVDNSYHMDYGALSFHYKNYGFGKADKPIKVIHFPGKKKPWMNRLNHIEHYVKNILRRNWISFKAFAYYDYLLNIVIWNTFKNKFSNSIK